jgi:hypothetical protein
MNKHGPKFINDYNEFKTYHININASRYKYCHMTQTFKTEKVCDEVCQSFDSNSQW